MKKLTALSLSFALAFVMFHRLDGHSLWISCSEIDTVQGAGQLGYPDGTLVNVGGINHTVKEDVNQVVRELRAVCDPVPKAVDTPTDPH